MHISGHTGLQVRQNHPQIPSRDSPEGSPKCHPSLSSCPAGLVAPHFPLALFEMAMFLTALNYFLFNPRAQLPQGWGCCSALLCSAHPGGRPRRILTQPKSLLTLGHVDTKSDPMQPHGRETPGTASYSAWPLSRQAESSLLLLRSCPTAFRPHSPTHLYLSCAHLRLETHRSTLQSD